MASGLRASTGSAWFAALIGDTQDLVTVLDRDGRVVYQTPSILPMLGYDADDHVGRHFAELAEGFKRRDVAQLLVDEGKVDYLDISLWDVFKDPVDPKFQGRSLMSYFTDIDLKGRVRLGFAGGIRTWDDANRCLEAGADFAVIGKAAVVHHDLPKRLERSRGFVPQSFPVSADYLRKEGLGEGFITYLATWPNMVTDHFVPEDVPRFDVDEFFKTGRSVKLAEQG